MVKTLRWRLVVYLALAGLLTFIVNCFLSRGRNTELDHSLTPIAQEFFRVISPSTYKYIHAPQDQCKERRPYLVLMVPAAPDDHVSRNAIRKTWGQEDQIPGVDILRVFFVGLPTGNQAPRIQEGLEKESQDHRDIIQMDFVDSYSNLTVKTMMMMHWLTSRCPGASYAMKIDADIFLNVHYLIHRVLGPRADPVRRNYITGSVIRDGRPRRLKTSKWYMPEDVYPEDWYPPYVSGAGYVFSVDLAERISWASRFVRPVPLEDVYVGLCLRVLAVRPAFSFSLASMHNVFEIRYIEYERCTYFSRVIVTGVQPQEMLRIWPDFQLAQFSC